MTTDHAGIRGLRWGTLLLLAVFLPGCDGSPSTVPVEGVVLINGVPAEDLLIQFTPVQWDSNAPVLSSSAVSDGSGRFVLMAGVKKPGAVAGKHKVIVVDNKLNTDEEPGASGIKKRPVNRIPRVYTSASTTPIEIVVEAGKKDYEIRIEARR